MKIVEERDDGAIIDLTTDELRLIFGVLIEVRNGPRAFDDDDWNGLIGQPRELEKSVIDKLQPVVTKLTAKL